MTDKLVLIDIYKDKKMLLGYKTADYFKIGKEIAELSKKYNCDKKKNYSDYMLCAKQYKAGTDAIYLKYDPNYIPGDEGNYYYIVLNKATALEQIFSQVDFGLFDPELAKKKDTIIEENQ